jgi:hypothetical protein
MKCCGSLEGTKLILVELIAEHISDWEWFRGKYPLSTHTFKNVVGDSKIAARGRKQKACLLK